MKTEKLDELLQADRQMESRRFMATPVAKWTVLGDPMAKDFVCDRRFDPTRARQSRLSAAHSAMGQVRRHRLAKKHL